MMYKTKMWAVTYGVYQSDNGMLVRQEYGTHPWDNAARTTAGEWVLRDADDDAMDANESLDMLAEENNLEINWK